VSLQWGAQEVDCFGNDWPLSSGEGWITAPSRPDRVLKTVGTNSAFRAEPLREIGFDRAYRFYLDETDVNWRLTKMGWGTVIVPDAEVHHGFAGSQYRTSERVPKSLKEIGASKAYFCKRFGMPSKVSEELDGFRRDQLSPNKVGALIDTLEEGFVIGAGRPQGITSLKKSPSSFRQYDGLRCSESLLLTTRIGSRYRAYKQAKSEASDRAVTLFDFSYTARMMTVRFTEDGFWLHKGGIFGRTERRGPLFFANTYLERVRQESIRIAAQRKMSIAK
jgi:cellulose synthase/poly-beta-1,6-N-acetylglucosamine synthase-like glycosyltransferase